MLTPQEVTAHEFGRAVFGGYDIASVDKFLDQLTEDYSALYKESGILKTKMKVLVDKVEEYRSTEDAMRMALLQAEKTAKEIIAEAEKRRDAIDGETARLREDLMKQAEADAEARRAELKEALSAEEAALERAKKATAEYLGRLKASLGAYTDTLDRVYDYVEPVLPAEEAAPAPAASEPAPEPEPEPEPTKDLGKDPDAPVIKGVSQDTVDRIALMIDKSFSSTDQSERPPEESVRSDATSTKTLNIDYENLKFGDTYVPSDKNGGQK